MSKEVKEVKEKPVVKASDVLKMLEEGKTREEIGLHYGLNKRQTKLLFTNPILKGRKTHYTKGGKLIAFEFTDDIPEEEKEALRIAKEERAKLLAAKKATKVEGEVSAEIQSIDTVAANAIHHIEEVAEQAIETIVHEPSLAQVAAEETAGNDW